MKRQNSMTSPKSRMLALSSSIFGLAFWIPLLNFIFGVAAVMLGIMALLNIKKHPDKYAGTGYAITGIVLGAIPIVFSVLGLGMCLSGYKAICKSMGLSFLA